MRLRRLAGAFARPHFLEIIELAHFRPEDVNDGRADIDQNPIAGLQPLDPDFRHTIILEMALQLVARDSGDDLIELTNSLKAAHERKHKLQEMRRDANEQGVRLRGRGVRAVSGRDLARLGGFCGKR